MKNVLITGASRGLGSYLAKYMAKCGYGVIINYVKEEQLAKEVKQEIIQKYQTPVWLMKGDISLPDDVWQMYQEFKKLGISLDVLILNAGIDHVSELDEKTYETMLRVLKVNLVGNFMMTKLFGQLMEDNQKGCIIYINSDNVLGNNDIVTLEYDVSKAGLLMLAKDFSQYFNYVKVHSIASGWLDTDMNKAYELEHDLLNFVPFEDVCEEVGRQIKEKESGNVVRVYERIIEHK